MFRDFRPTCHLLVQACLPATGSGAQPSADIVSTIRGVSLEPDVDPELQFHVDYLLDKDVYFRHAYKVLIPFFVKAWSEFQYPRPDSLPKINEPEDADRA